MNQRNAKKKAGIITAGICGAIFLLEILAVSFFPDVWNEFVHNFLAMVGCLGLIYGVLLAVWDDFR